MPRSRPVFERKKDRLSYNHGGITFDLTQVKGAAVSPILTLYIVFLLTVPKCQGENEVRHELELEIMDTAKLARECEKMDRREKSEYLQIIETLVNNVRILSRKALRY